MAAILRDEVAAGRVASEGDGYSLNRQAFPADLLDALERLGER